MEVTLYRITCKDCAWFQTFETKAQADESERMHQAEGHHTVRHEFQGEPPTLSGKSHLYKQIAGAR